MVGCVSLEVENCEVIVDIIQSDVVVFYFLSFGSSSMPPVDSRFKGWELFPLCILREPLLAE